MPTRLEKARVNITLPRDLWKRARLQVVEEDTDLSELIARLLEEYLAKPGRKGRR